MIKLEIDFIIHIIINLYIAVTCHNGHFDQSLGWPLLISLQFATNVYYFYHTNSNFLDPALIQAPGAYSGKYGIS